MKEVVSGGTARLLEKAVATVTEEVAAKKWGGFRELNIIGPHTLLFARQTNPVSSSIVRHGLVQVLEVALRSSDGVGASTSNVNIFSPHCDTHSLTKTVFDDWIKKVPVHVFQFVLFQGSFERPPRAALLELATYFKSVLPNSKILITIGPLQLSITIMLIVTLKKGEASV